MSNRTNALPKVLLLVDDDDFVVLAVRQQLLQSGCNVDSARTIDSALALIRLKSYSCVCIDLHLTGSTTEECLHLIERVRMILPAASILAATAYPSAYLTMTAIAAGADRLLHKVRDVRAVALDLQSACDSMRHRDRSQETETASS